MSVFKYKNGQTYEIVGADLVAYEEQKALDIAESQRLQNIENARKTEWDTAMAESTASTVTELRNEVNDMKAVLRGLFE